MSDEWTSKSSFWNYNSADSIKKGRLKQEKPDYGFKSYFDDPFAPMSAMGYQNRPYLVPFDTLKKVPQQLSIVAAIIQTRINQIASFSIPMRNSKSIGYEIKHKNPGRLTTKGEREFILELEKFVFNCGQPNPNPYAQFPRDGFDHFLKKVVRDTLMYDQVCALAGTWVELADGTGCPIEEIQTGMKVRTHTGNVREVVQPKSHIHTGDFVDIQVRGQKLSVTGGHPVYVANRVSSKGNTVKLGTPAWVAARELTKDMYVVYPKLQSVGEYQNISIFDDNPRKPERIQEFSTTMDEKWGAVIGLYLAEGNCRPHSVAFTFNSEEQDLVDLVKDFGTSLGITSTIVDYSERAAVTIILNSVNLSRFFKKYCNTGSKEKTVPQFILNSPASVRKELIKHYLLGDGHIRNNLAKFGTVSRNLFTGMRSLLSAEGIYVAEIVSNGKYDNHAEQYVGNISGVNYRRLAREWGFPSDESSCRTTYLDIGDSLYVKITSIKKYDDENIPVYNMEVEEDHSYIAQGFINHNCFEVVPDRRGLPYEFMAVDASTIRIAAPNTLDMYKYSGANTIDETFDTMRGPLNNSNDRTNFVQLVHGQIRNLYSRNELAFGVRNPRTDIRVYGYGYSELEQLIRTITAAIYAEEYNIRNFSQGSSPKGILSFKGEAMDPDMLEDFKRKWNQNVEGVHNAWRTPIIQSETGIEWTDLHPNNRDMEYNSWLEYLIKIICGVFLIDPAEVNFDLHGGVQQTPLFESSQEWKLKASRDRGLKPLLKFLAKMINDNVIQKLDDNFTFDFVGLDELTEQEKHELRKEQVASYMTLNEIRRAEDLPDIEDGDRVLNPTYLQAVQLQQQADQQEEQMAMQGDAAGQGGAEAGAEEAAPEEEEEEDPSPPYVENFTKSQPQRTFEISDLDDWFDEDASV